MRLKDMPVRDIVIIAILFILLVAWGPLYQKFMAPAPAAHEGQAGQAPAATAAATNLPAADSAPAAVQTAAEPALSAEAPIAAEPPAPPAAVASSAPAPEAPAEPAEPAAVIVVSNGLARIGISEEGGGIVFAELIRYPTSLADGRPVRMDFAAMPALSLVEPTGGAGPGADLIRAFGPKARFTATVDADGRTARIERTAAGLEFVRTVQLGDGYRMAVTDRFVNRGTAGVEVGGYSLQLGAVRLAGHARTLAKDSAYLGIDTLASAGGEPVRQWTRSSFFSKREVLSSYFLPEGRRGGGCAAGRAPLEKPLPGSVTVPQDQPTDWVAVKDKFFVQVLAPEGGAAGFDLQGRRYVPEQEDPASPGSWAKNPIVTEVAARVLLSPLRLAPGEARALSAVYYVGPKEYVRIAELGNHAEDIMEFGRLKHLCRFLLSSLKAVHGILPNYGVAIIVITVLIRIIFWPITRKSTESMKRMQDVQPQVALLREKYRDKPQKMQQEIMQLYRENKVNPVGGCLPMLIQIPVFIALFNVLRSAVELRFAPFLWVGDLSEPENLLAGVLPFGLNILPIFMTATMVWQQKLTPSAGDPQQQKMMMFMPVMMLFIFYNMPSALVLYWSANQVLMIIQLLWQKRAKKKAAA